MENLQLHKVRIHGFNEDEWDIYMAPNLVGNGNYGDLEFDRDKEDAMSSIPVRFDFTDDSAGISKVRFSELKVIPSRGGILIKDLEPGETIRVIKADGNLVEKVNSDSNEIELSLPEGVYIIHVGNGRSGKIII